jgi:hypothetical protein
MSLASVKYGKYAHLVPDVVAYEFYTSVSVSSKSPLFIYINICYLPGGRAVLKKYFSEAGGKYWFVMTDLSGK